MNAATRPPADRHAGAARRRFLVRLLWGALWRRRSRLVIALGAVAVGASVAAGLWLVTRDVERQVSRELKAYGPNVLVVPAGDAVRAGLSEIPIASMASRPTIPASAVTRLRAARPWSGARPDGTVRILDAVPVLYGAARAGRWERTAVLVAGTDLEALEELYDGWRRERAARETLRSGTEAHAGATLASRLGLVPGDTLLLEPQLAGGRSLVVRVAVVHAAGGAEDEALYLPLAAAQRVLGAGDEVSLVLVRAAGIPESIHAALAAGWLAGESWETRPIRRMAVSERSLLDRLGWVFGVVTALALLAAALSAGSTLADLVLERRQEVALLKALGAGRWHVLALFLGEALGLGVAGGVLGFGVGALAAQVIGGGIFGSAIRLDWSVLPLVVLLATLATVVASWLPVRRALAVEAASVLRGE